MPNKLKDLTGQVFGKLTVNEHAGRQGRITLWRCVCSCGMTTTIRRDHLIDRTVISCGCTLSLIRARGSRHGHKRKSGASREYKTWQNMWARCTNPIVDAYPYYGGRGITVCDRWKDFKNFLSDMGPKPKGLTLERVKVNGSYNPANCVWATQSVQVSNRRKL
jgi:hypothetical protein